MKSFLTDNFVACFKRLPERIKLSARRNYQIWKKNPNHPGLQFKKVGRTREVYSIRVGIGWRALGVKDKESMIWFWIGSHAEYDRLIKHS